MNKKVLIFILIAIVLVVSAIYLEQNHIESSSVGIIGGADGPTSILVTSSMAPASVAVISLIAVILLSALILFFKHRR